MDTLNTFQRPEGKETNLDIEKFADVTARDWDIGGDVHVKLIHEQVMNAIQEFKCTDTLTFPQNTYTRLHYI